MNYQCGQLHHSWYQFFPVVHDDLIIQASVISLNKQTANIKQPEYYDINCKESTIVRTFIIHLISDLYYEHCNSSNMMSFPLVLDAKDNKTFKINHFLMGNLDSNS